MAYDPEVKEFAYNVWRNECSRNVDETVRRLNSKYGYVISRKAISSWRKKFDWEGRAAKAEAEERLLARDSSYSALLLSLIRQKQKYEEYLNSLPVTRIDTQAVYAYNGIIKTIVTIQAHKSAEGGGAADRPKIFMENMEFIAQVLKKIDPEGLRILNRSFDRIILEYKKLEQKGTECGNDPN